MARAATVADDPYMHHFDKGVGLAAYALLFVSIFGAGLPALGGVALAFSHRKDAHPVVRSHFRFQARIFWTTIGLLALSLILLLGGGGMELTSIVGFVQEHMTGWTPPGWAVEGYRDPAAHAAGDWMLGGGLLLAIFAVFWLMAASLWGFFKLVLGRPIGQRLR